MASHITSPQLDVQQGEDNFMLQQQQQKRKKYIPFVPSDREKIIMHMHHDREACAKCQRAFMPSPPPCLPSYLSIAPKKVEEKQPFPLLGSEEYHCSATGYKKLFPDN